MSEKNSNKTTYLSKVRLTAEQIFDDTKDFLANTYRASGFYFTSASPFSQILKVLANMFELLFFYLEDAIVENNPATANNIETIFGNAQIAGHNPTRAIAATGEIRFKFRAGKESEFNGPYVIINDNTKIKCTNNNLIYTIKLSSDFIKVTKGSVDFVHAVVMQGTFESQKVFGTGLSMQTFNFKTNGEADHNNVKVFVNGKLWKIYESLYDMNGGDIEGVLVRTGISGGIDIIFGNGYFGKAPINGSIIEIQYLINAGSLGTVGGNSGGIVYQFIDNGITVTGDDIDLNEFLIIDTVIPPRLGTDAEDTNFTKILAPMASKSFVLAGPENYEYFLSRYNTFSYIDAFNTVDDNYIDDDNITYLYILPDIERKLTSDIDYFTLPLEEFTLDEFEKNGIRSAIRESGQQATGSEIQFVDVKIKKYAVQIILRYFNNYDTDTLSDTIRTKLGEYFLTVKRRDRVPKSDLIAIIEAIEGIDSVNIYFISEENETAIKNGYYFSETFKVQPTTPFLQEGEGTKKRFVFFNKQLIKTKHVIDSTKDPLLGLDEFGDIVISSDTLSIIRGGWYDRTGTYVEEYPTKNKVSGLSIFFKEGIDNTLNSRVQSANKKKLK